MAPSGIPAEMRQARPEIANQKAREQRADAGAQGELDAADSEAQENANETAEEDGKPQHDEIDAGAGRHDDTDTLSGVLDGVFGSDDA